MKVFEPNDAKCCFPTQQKYYGHYVTVSSGAAIRLIDLGLTVLMGQISLGYTACILAFLWQFTSATPLEKGPTGPLSPAPQVEPRDVVTVTRHVVNSAVQSNPPFYDTACKVGGCTFDYEASSSILSVFAP